MKIRANVNGYAQGYQYSKGQVLDLPESVLKALDPRDYVLLEEAPRVEKKKEETKEVKKASNKGPKKKASK